MISTSRRRRPRLEAVRRQFDRWRQTRAHPRAPLPRRLWAAAVALVPEHGVYGTARVLGVSYGALKQHVDRHTDEPRERPRAQFVELLPPAPAADGYVIDIEGAAGTTVRVQLHGVVLSELAEFTRLVVGATS
jgi:hypothetical protein